MSKDKSKFKNGELIVAYYSLDKLDGLKGVKFLYALNKNLSKLEKEVKTLEKSVDMTDKYKEFETKKAQLNERMSQKEKNGSPKIMRHGDGRSTYVIDQGKKIEHKEEMDKLLEEYKEEIENRDKEIKEYSEFLESENKDFSPYLIDPDIIPDDISWEQYKIIRKFIEEREE